MQTGLKEQEDRINNRIKMRRMKSECFSPRKFDIDLGSNPPEQKERHKMNEEKMECLFSQNFLRFILKLDKSKICKIIHKLSNKIGSSKKIQPQSKSECS